MKPTFRFVINPLRPSVHAGSLLIALTFAFVGDVHAQTTPSNVLLQVGAASGANNKIDASKSYTYNFGVTSLGAGLLLNQITLGVGRQNGVTAGITVEVYQGFGGSASGNQLISSTSFDASTFNLGAQIQNYNLTLPGLSLAPGAYSVRIVSSTPTNSSYAFRDGLLSMGGGITSEKQWIQDSNTGGTAGTTIAPQGGYVLADHASNTQSVNLGRYHVNTAPSAVVNLTNSAPATSTNVTESLTVSQGTITGAAQVSSLPTSHLLRGASHGVTVGLSPAAGAQTGSVLLNFNSVKDGSSSTRSDSNPVSVGNRTISISGFGYTGKSEWTANASGSWNLNDHANWLSNGGTPGLDGSASVGDTALFGSAATANRTISLNGSNPGLSTLTFDNSTASYTISAGSGGTLTVGNATNAGLLTNSSGSHTISAPLALGSNTTVDTAAGSSLVLSGAISGNAYGLTKTGTGRLELAGVASYGGTTNIQAGTLVVNGNMSTAGGAMTIGSSARLEGSGTIGGNVTISGVHSPGNSPGIQTFEEDGLTYTTGASVVWELIDNTLTGRGSNYDGIDVGGDLTFAAPTSLSLNFALAESGVDWTNSFWDLSRIGDGGWKIYDVDGSISGFANLQLTPASWFDGNGLSLSDVRPDASFSLYQSSDGIYLNYSAVPEPGAALLGGLGFILLLRRRRA